MPRSSPTGSPSSESSLSSESPSISPTPSYTRMDMATLLDRARNLPWMTPTEASRDHTLCPELHSLDECSNFNVRVLGWDPVEIAPHTYFHRTLNHPKYGISLYNTFIVIYDRGTVRLDTGGYHSALTRERMGRYMPRHLHISQGWQFIQDDSRPNGARSLRYNDGMVIPCA